MEETFWKCFSVIVSKEDMKKSNKTNYYHCSQIVNLLIVLTIVVEIWDVELENILVFESKQHTSPYDRLSYIIHAF